MMIRHIRTPCGVYWWFDAASSLDGLVQPVNAIWLEVEKRKREQIFCLLGEPQ